MHPPEHIRIERSRIRGLFLSLFGHSYSGIALSDAGVTLLGREPKDVPFPDIPHVMRKTKTMGMPSVTVDMRDGCRIKVAGVPRDDAERFVSIANAAWRQYFIEQVNEVDQELYALADVVDRLDQPNGYPSACLLEPFLLRANHVLSKLPEHMPKGVLPTKQREALQKVVRFKKAPHYFRDEAIKTFADAELAACKGFFDKIESNPLTPEQRRAIVTDEDATLVLAGAGSGKTSVIVAKAAYLIERGIRQPNEILLIAFGKDAAEEMSTRIKERTGATVAAMTFHALGYDIIRKAERGTPTLAPQASDDVQFRALLRDILITDIATRPDLLELLLKWFSEFFWPHKSEFDFKTKDEYFQYVEAHELRTLQGEMVKSFEEWKIANWLYLNGIAYEYERRYEHELPGKDRKPYQPDFWLSESGIYIEHFGVRISRGPDGRMRYTTAPHVDRERYIEDMKWKRNVHKEHGTALIQTFSYENSEGRLTERLAKKLQPYVTPKPIPHQKAFDRLLELGQMDDFTPIAATFLRHFKGSGFTMERCRKRTEDSGDKRRGLAFLQIFEAVLEAYEKRLGDRIDFEDMIARATEYVKTGRYRSPYRHLLVDEFQDMSEGRADLLRALKAQHRDARIFGVGDDWQSIFRFAGSDIHLMRNFGKEFGGIFAGSTGIHATFDLGRTFRSVDKVALAARRFVLRNPSQIEKQVIPSGTTDAPAIKIATHANRDEEAALLAALGELNSSATEGETSVLLLGRYRFVKPKNLVALASNYPGLSLRFMTVHASKGLEADHVVILGAISGRMGFPSEITDDPLIDLVLPEPEKFDHAEERRLFYVALTRAKKSVTVLADREKPSAFVRELLKDPEYQAVQVDDSGIAERHCTACSGRMLERRSKNGRTYFSCEYRRLCGEMLWPCNVCGKDIPVANEGDPTTMICSCGAVFNSCPNCFDNWLVERNGRYGKFLGCVRYPDCDGRMQIQESENNEPRRH